MRGRNLRRNLVALGLVLALLVAAAGLVGVPRVVVASPIEVASTDYLNVTAFDFAFTPNLIQDLPTNETIHVVVTDGDTADTAHTFTIWSYEGHQFPSSASDISSYVYGHGANEGYLANVNVTALAPGDRYLHGHGAGLVRVRLHGGGPLRAGNVRLRFVR